MRILQLHCDSIVYTPTKKEISTAEEIEPKTVHLDEIVVCFVAIEKEDDENVVQNAVLQIEETMQKIGGNAGVYTVEETEDYGWKMPVGDKKESLTWLIGNKE